MKELLLILLCVLAEAFFSGSEFAFVSSRWARLRREAEKGDAPARLLVRFWLKPDSLLATTLVGSNLSVIAASVLATSLALELAREGGLTWFSGREEILVMLCLAPITLLFGEIIPKSVAQGLADRMARKVVYPMVLARALFSPLTFVMTLFSGGVRRALRGRAESSPFVTREELAMMVRLRDLRTELKKHERKMIRRLFTFRETRVGEVMVPLDRVAALEDEQKLQDALDLYGRMRYTRYPVYRGDSRNIVGVLNALDCLPEPNLNRRVGRLAERTYYVPQNKSVVDLMREMEREGVRMAVVVDEYGGAVGMVTKEDVLEEIVGELEDEYDTRRRGWRHLDAGRFEAAGHLEVGTAAEELGIDIPRGEYGTLAGLMIHRLGRIPRKGEEVIVGAITLKALEVSRRTVEKVRISLESGKHG